MTLTEADIRAAIANTVLSLDATSIDSKADFYDIGIDSLDHASILLDLQERHGLIVSDADLSECRSIDGILRYAAEK